MFNNKLIYIKLYYKNSYKLNKVIIIIKNYYKY